MTVSIRTNSPSESFLESLQKLLPNIDPEVRRILEKALRGGEVSVDEGITLFTTRGRELEALLRTADRIRYELSLIHI